MSAHTITPQNDIVEWFTAFRLHGTNHIFQTTHWCYSIMVLVLGHHIYTFTPYLTCCTFKITTRCKKQKTLIFEFHFADHFYSSQRNWHKQANHHQIIQPYVSYKHDLTIMCSFKNFDLTLKVQAVSSNALFLCRTEENDRCKKRFTSGENGQLWAFYLCHCFT